MFNAHYIVECVCFMLSISWNVYVLCSLYGGMCMFYAHYIVECVCFMLSISWNVYV